MDTTYTVLILDKEIAMWLRDQWESHEQAQVDIFDRVVKDHLGEIEKHLSAAGFARTVKPKRQRRKIGVATWKRIEESADKFGLDKIALLRACLRLEMKK